MVMKTDVATVTNPTNEGGSQTSTLDNLEANIATELGLQTPTAPTEGTGTSGSAEPATTPPTEPPAAAESGTKTENAEAAAKATRIEQDNANLRATLTKLGVDPDSSTAEQLRTGLITVDDILRTRQPVQPAQPTEPDATATEVPLNQKLIDLQNALSNQKGDVSAEQYRETQSKMIEVITGLVKANQNINQMQEDNALQSLLDKTVATTKDVFNTTVTATVPDDVKEIGQDFFIGATDIEVGNLAREVGRERAFTIEGYRHMATKMAPKYDKFVQAVYKAGEQAAIAAINKGNPPGTPPVNPLTPGGGGAPPAPPTDKNQFTLDNLNKNVDALIGSTQAQV